MTTDVRPINERYEMVVGLEVHVQLKTRSKAFCNCPTAYGSAPNTQVCPVCLALPGALPVLNFEAVNLAARAAIALDCTVHATSIFARKNYFYPDLPKGYQITQYDRPLATDGCVVIGHRQDKSPITVGVTRVHMEEDAGKSVHDRYPTATAIDLNRAGVPLIEIVSEPDMRSSEEAGAYLRVLKQILAYMDVSDVSMEEGSLRVDANVSARERGQTKLGTKTEVKNMNSFSAVERALDTEFARQCALLDRGGKVEQQTMLWDGATGAVRPSRSKEQSHDYRYFPEPDLPPLVLSNEWIEEVRSSLPERPQHRRERYVREYGLGERDIDSLTSDLALSDYFEGIARQHGDPKSAANWVNGEVRAELNARGIDISQFKVRSADLVKLLNMVSDSVVSHSAAKRIFAVMAETGEQPEQIASREKLIIVSDDSALRDWITEVLAEHPVEAQRFRAGEKKLQGVLVGFVMKKSKGSADPKRVNQLLAERAIE